VVRNLGESDADLQKHKRQIQNREANFQGSTKATQSEKREEEIMPNVSGRMFPYTKAGKSAAKKAAKKVTAKKKTSKKKSSRRYA
tara:strand:- start:59 stop:313 length:255 start_codon:yes stop_codon:yes gene_type:complete